MNTSSEQEQEPSIELRPLPTGWSWANLGELGLVRLGKTPRKSDYRDLGDHKIVKFRDVDEHGHVDWHNPVKGFVDSAPEVTRTLKDLQKNDVLVTASAHMSEHIGKKVGIVANIPGQFKGAYVVGEILQVRAREGIEPKWILYYLRSTDGYKAIQRRVHGVHLISSRAQNIEIPVAPLDQQKRIVAEIEKQFSRLDEAVANLKRVKANLKRYKAAVLKAAVEGRLVETEAEIARREGRNYETGAQLLQRILETRRSQWQGKGKYKEPAAPDTAELPELPEGRCWTTLDAIADVVDPNPSHRMPKYVQTGVPFISSENFVGEEGIDFEIGKHVSEETLKQQRAKFSIEHGDFVLSRIGTIGKTRFLPVGTNYCLSHALVVIKTFSNLIHKEWLRRTIASDSILSQAREGVQSVGVPDLGMAKIRNFSLPLPPANEQKRIAAEVDRHLTLLRETEAQVNANMQRAERLRQSILSRAFSALCHR